MEWIPRDGVDREVPTAEILFQLADEGDPLGAARVAVLGFHAKGGDLAGPGVREDRDRPESGAGGDRFREETEHLVRGGARAEIPILRRGLLSDEKLPHRSPDHIRAVARILNHAQHVEDRLGDLRGLESALGHDRMVSELAGGGRAP